MLLSISIVAWDHCEAHLSDLKFAGLRCSHAAWPNWKWKGKGSAATQDSVQRTTNPKSNSWNQIWWRNYGRQMSLRMANHSWKIWILLTHMGLLNNDPQNCCSFPMWSWLVIAGCCRYHHGYDHRMTDIGFKALVPPGCLLEGLSTQQETHKEEDGSTGALRQHVVQPCEGAREQPGGDLLAGAV